MIGGVFESDSLWLILHAEAHITRAESTALARFEALRHA
jgi:hypothetical protein